MAGISGLLLLALLAGADGPAPPAGQDETWTLCEDDDDEYPAAQRIEACTAIIQSGLTNRTDLATAYVDRGIGYDDSGDETRAFSDYTSAIAEDSSYEGGYYERGVLYFDTGDLDAAISDLSGAIERAPDDSNAYGSRGFALFKKGDLDGAIVDLSQAIHLDPDNALAYHDRSLVYAAKGDRAHANADQEEAAHRDPADYGKRPGSSGA